VMLARLANEVRNRGNSYVSRPLGFLKSVAIEDSGRG